MCQSVATRISRRVPHRGGRAPACRSVTVLPWRSHLAVVLSVAAIAGCGQPPTAPPDGTADVTANARDAAAPTPPRAGREVAGAATPRGDDATAQGAGSSEPVRRGAAGDVTEGGGGPDDASVAPDPAVPADEPDVSAPRPDTGDDGPDAGVDDGAAPDLDVLERTVVTLLTAARVEAGAPQVQIDAALVADARDHACTMAHGVTPLVPDADHENVGLVVEPEPDAAARAMHDWWMRSSAARSVRMAGGFTRYGVGACTEGERVYYAERFAA